MRVSISVVCYNQEKTIEYTVLSCLNQEYDDFEVIVSDDASTDKTPQILTRLAELYPERLKIILNSTNVGITKNCNICLSHCTGELIALCAGDDVLYPNKIPTQAKEFQNNNNLVFCYHPTHIIEKAIITRTIGNKRKDMVKDMYDYMARPGAYIPAPSAMIRKSAIPAYGYDEKIPTASDWLFNIECMSKGETLRIDKILSAYRLHENNIGKSFIKYIDDFLLTEKILQEKYASKKASKSARKGIKRILLGSIYRAVISSDVPLLNKSMSQYKSYNVITYHLLRLLLCFKVTKFLFSHARKFIKRFV